MKETARSKELSLLGSNKVIFFGYGRHDAARNMAIDDALFLNSIETGQFFLRFYDFDRPSIILARFDHPDSINRENLSDVGVSRRKSGGDPIYLDDISTFSYSISGRFSSSDSFGFDFKGFVHNNLGPIVADAIKGIVMNDNIVELGKHNSIRLNDGPVAAHAQNTHGWDIEKDEKHYAFLYQGVVAIGKWDPDKIRSVLRICDEDYEALGHLPNISQVAKAKKVDLNEYKIEFMNAMLNRILNTNEILNMSDRQHDEIAQVSDHLFDSEYSNPGWVFDNNPNLKIRSKFCLCNYDF